MDLNNIQKEMKSLPMGELLHLRDKIGETTFTEIYHGHRQTLDQSKSEKKVRQAGDKRKDCKFSSPTSILRKDLPTELSSKRQISRSRQIISIPKKKRRDPRFDENSGDYNEDIFNRNYSFIEDIRQRERQELEEKYKSEQDKTTQKKLKNDLRHMKRTDSSVKKKKETDQRVAEWKAKEKERVKGGKRPFYLKKSDMKNLALVDEYKRLKKEGRLEAYLKTRRKRHAQKQHSKIPD